MYKVLCDNALMCDSRIEELALINPVVKLEENKAGSFSFKIPPAHPYYNTIQKRKTIVEVYQDDDLIFSGMCIEATTDFYKRKDIYCEGELTYFNDSVQRPARYQGATVRGLLEAYIANHNAQVEESKRFEVGQVTVTDPNNYISCYTNMESTMKAIKEDLVDDLGGIIRIRHENGVKYVDYLAESPNTNSQVIKLGKNLTDFKSNIDSTDIATAIIPLGAKLEQSSVEGLETRLTIESLNEGLDYVHSAEAVNEYGWIYKTVTYDNVTTPEALKRKGEQYLSETQFENVVIEAKAIDLHFTDKSIERFKLSDQIRVKSAPHGLNKYFRLTKQTLNLNSPEKDKITLGKTEKQTLSAKTNQASEEIRKAVESIVPPNHILQQAVSNATALITSAMGGYVVKTNEELLIMDTDNIETATKVWRWNINGLGYSSNGYKGPYALAMTMDGRIVADFVAAGTMYADRIKGGTLKLGGNNNENGILLIVDKNGNTVGRWDKDGIVLPEGTSISWKQIQDKPQIGGTNLLLNTEKMEANWGGRMIHTYGAADPLGGNAAHSLQGTSTSDSFWGQESVTVFKKPGKYVLSFWARASRGCYLPITGGTTEIKYVQLTTEWQKFTVDFDIETVTRPGFYFGGWYSWTLTDVVIDVFHPKLEEGTVPTDWDYSPVDIQSQITANAEQIQLKVSSGDVVSVINQSADAIHMAANRFSWDSSNSSLTSEGKLTAKEAVFEDADITYNTSGGTLHINGNGIRGVNKIEGIINPCIRLLNEESNVEAWVTSMDWQIVKWNNEEQTSGARMFGVNHLGELNSQSLAVSGTKSRIATTENYKDRLLYCYEMPTPFFGDIGEGQLDDEGICYVYLDDIFMETVDTSCNYQVFLQMYGEGNVIVTERDRNYFIVKGTPGLKFAWEIKAKQAGYTMERLEEYTQTEAEVETNYEAESTIYLQEYERSILNYE